MRRTGAAVGTLVFLAIAPGVVVGLVPWMLTGWRMQRSSGWRILVIAAGAMVLATGVLVLLQAFARFVVEGLGTPAPVAPTERLVVGGMYRHVRNPMYIAVVGAIIGQALVLGQPVLLLYAVAVWATIFAFVVWYEEPTLTRQFGADYVAYRAAVPRWWPRLRPYGPRTRRR